MANSVFRAGRQINRCLALTAFDGFGERCHDKLAPIVVSDSYPSRAFKTLTRVSDLVVTLSSLQHGRVRT